MNRLTAAFESLRRAQRRALLPYVTGGYPDPAVTVDILRQLDPQRCACVEVGIPFSDPIADGPVIQASFSRALDHGFRLDALLAAIRDARDDIRVPLLAMVSYSIVYRRDPAAFVDMIRAAGLDGMIVPDLSFEEAEDLARIGRERDCPLVMMVAPTTSPERRRRIAELSEPFIYYQSLAGVTGERSQLPPDLAAHVQELREATGKPICVGFGISRPEHVRTVCDVADGAIVGSAIVRRITEALDRDAPPDEIVDTVLAFVDELTAVL